MKKLLFLAVALFAFCACNRDDMNGPNDSPGKKEVVPHFYGWMTLDNDGPQTRGVANSSKVWSRPIAEKNLTVKFLNGTERYQSFVKEAVQEWSKYANVKFQFVSEDKDALIRVGFDYVKGMSSSWALTGTDHLQVYDNQDEATVHFSQWRRASDAAKRSDVLRAFGQVLGLELEFRHPGFYPAWITDAEGNIDEATIREYWEYELNDLISWEELKKIVLDPLNVPAFLIEKTQYYDQESVMSWPFYEMIARNIPVVEFDEDYKTELSEQDKKFIESLYGKPKNTIGIEDYYELVTFNYTGIRAQLSLTISEDVIVIWDETEGDISKDNVSYVEIPADELPPYTVTVTHEFAENKTYKIVVAQLLKYGQDPPAESSALQGFDLLSGDGMENLNLQPGIINNSLSLVRVQGGVNFKPQQFNFESNPYLKELYLSNIGNSKVKIDNCENLEIFATSHSIAKFDLRSLIDMDFSDIEIGPAILSKGDAPVDKLILNQPLITIIPRDSLIVPWFPEEPDSLETGGVVLRYLQPWPCDPQQNYSLSDDGGKGLTILNCPNLKKISLENTRMKTFDFANFTKLEYVYLSSTPEYLVGLGSPEGDNLRAALGTLKNRTSDTMGQIIIRGITFCPQYRNPCYEYSAVEFDRYYINSVTTRRNWAICWDPEFKFIAATTANN